jgi:hypothetical protein
LVHKYEMVDVAVKKGGLDVHLMAFEVVGGSKAEE